MPKNLTRIKEFADTLGSTVLRQEIMALMEKVFAFIKDIKDSNSREWSVIKTAVAVEMEKMKKEMGMVSMKHHDKMMSEMKGALKEQENGMKFIYDKVASLKDGETPTREELLSLIAPLIPKVENGKDGSPDTPEQIAAKLNLKTEVVDMSVIKGLREEIERLGRIRRTMFGGGTSGIGVAAAMSNIVKKETPTGDINGSNTTYTVTEPINAILSFGINGMVIHDSEYTVAGRTITMTTAIPAELSGTTFRIVYV